MYYIPLTEPFLFLGPHRHCLRAGICVLPYDTISLSALFAMVLGLK